jgi:hypothetical protein
MFKLKNILKEYTPSDPTALDKAMKEIERLGPRNPLNPQEIIVDNSVLIEVSIFDKRIWFSSIYSMDKGQGNAGKVMQKIVDIADKYGVTVALDAEPFSTAKDKLNKSQLVKFYKKYGFKSSNFGEMERVARKV